METMKTIKTLILLTGSLLLCAASQSSIIGASTISSSPVKVIDARNRIIGQAVIINDDNQVLFTIGKQFFTANVLVTGFWFPSSKPELFYPVSNCFGTPYLAANWETLAPYIGGNDAWLEDGQVMYADFSKTDLFTALSSLNQNNGICGNINDAGAFAPIATVKFPSFTPPFSLK